MLVKKLSIDLLKTIPGFEAARHDCYDVVGVIVLLLASYSHTSKRNSSLHENK